MQLTPQATVCDCLAFDPFAFEEDGLSAPEVDVSRGKIVEALVIAGMVVVRHEGGDLAFEIAGQVVIPPKRNRIIKRRYDTDLYKERNIIERFFNKLKQFRRVATRYDKLLANFMGFVKLAAIAIWLK